MLISLPNNIKIIYLVCYIQNVYSALIQNPLAIGSENTNITYGASVTTNGLLENTTELMNKITEKPIDLIKETINNFNNENNKNDEYSDPLVYISVKNQELSIKIRLTAKNGNPDSKLEVYINESKIIDEMNNFLIGQNIIDPNQNLENTCKAALFSSNFDISIDIHHCRFDPNFQFESKEQEKES